MFNRKILSAVALAAALATGASLAVAAHGTPETAAVASMGKLSSQGHIAFEDVAMARLAIFNGHPQEAKKLVRDAQQALKKAEADNTAFTAAEADLRPVSAQNSASAAPKGTTPLAWLPVDGRIALTEDYTATPAKKAATAAANEHLKKGNRDEAIKTLKLADINVAYTAALVPLKQTVVDVEKAAGLLSLEKYYEADQTLRQVEESMRFVWVDENMPMKTSAK